MYRPLALPLLVVLLAGPAAAELPFAANPNRCDTSGMPLGCIPLPNEMSGGAGSCNGDGVFNMPDYDGDPAVTDVNNNGVTDPEDLILLFSNGVDDDGNGYVDDICGYDFFEFDNDPFDEVQYGHGTGEAEDSSAEANNGGDLGACPNCMVMPVRVGDSFVADVNSFAQGVVFSVDSGAAVIQEALGTYNQSAFAQQAIDYAYAHGLPVMASAADEDAWHHVFPGPYVHAIMVNAIADFGVPNEPNSWLFLNGCTNFGGNLQVSISATSCSSEATGRSSGIAGLIVSAGRDAVDHGTLASRLTANEIRQLITQTADDINFDVPGGPAGTPPSTGGRTVTFPDTSDYDQFTYTIRVQVRHQPGNQLGEDRRTIFIHHDPDLKAPFPLRIGGDGASSPALADLDGDGKADIVFGTSDGLVYAKHADGPDLAGWPAAGEPIPYNPGSPAYATGAIPTPVRGAILASVAIGEIDGDGYLDLVAAAT